MAKKCDFILRCVSFLCKRKRCGNCCHHTVFYLFDKIWNPDLFAALSVAAHELVYATCRVHQLALACVERVRATGNFNFHYRIGFAFKFYGLARFASRTWKEHVAVAHVFEHYGTIILRMDIFLHCLIIFCQFNL